MSRARLVKLAIAALMLLGMGVFSPSQAQDWDKYYHWPQTPPQVPANGYDYSSLYDGFYVYPRDQRIVPQIQSPYYRNFYGGQRHFGLFSKESKLFKSSGHLRFYQGYHFTLDVF